MIALLLLVATCHLNHDSQGVITADAACTPGATRPVTKAEVCVKGSAGKARAVSAGEKNQVMRAYGLDPRTGKHPTLEIDHLISLELGGSNDAANLWPEPASPKPGFHEKDATENALHSAVCRGDLTLEQAQHLISTDWYEAYQKYVEGK